MIVIICGSRGFTDYEFISSILDRIFSNKLPDEIIHGDCKESPDMCAKRYAKERGIKCTPYPADWNTHKRAAGPIRNTKMSLIGTHCIGFNAGTKGTNDMLEKAKDNNLIVREIVVSLNPS